MDAHSVHQLHNPQQLLQGIHGSLQHYSCEVRHNKIVMVSKNAITGVSITITGANSAKLSWAIPNQAVMMGTILFMVLTGILPGAVLFLILYLITKSPTEAMKQEIASVLSGGAPHGAAAGYQMAGGQAQGGYGQAQGGYGQAQGGYGQAPAGPEGQAQAPMGVNFAPGASVLIVGPDGATYPGTFLQSVNGQAQCRFAGGEEGWYPLSSIQPN